MRNLLEYPITREEMVNAVNVAILTEEQGEQVCGDITVAALKEAASKLKGLTAKERGDLSEQMARAMEPQCWRMVDLGHECDGVKARVVQSIAHATAVLMLLTEKEII